MQSIKGKVALITGAGRGIGRSTAIAFAKEGIHVGLVGRTLENLQNVANELKEYDVNVAVAAASIEEIDSITKAVEQVRAELGLLTFLSTMRESQNLAALWT